MEKPEGIILTISKSYLKERGIGNWLRDFLNAMNNEDHTYWMRLGRLPKQEVLYIYLVIGNKIRFRFNFVMYEGPGEMEFDDGRIMSAKAWLVGCGPLMRPRRDYEMQGFRGFRYTETIF